MKSLQLIIRFRLHCSFWHFPNDLQFLTRRLFVQKSQCKYNLCANILHIFFWIFKYLGLACNEYIETHNKQLFSHTFLLLQISVYKSCILLLFLYSLSTRRLSESIIPSNAKRPEMSAIKNQYGRFPSLVEMFHSLTDSAQQLIWILVASE